MSIHKIGSDLIRPQGPGAPARGSGTAKQPDGEELRPVERADRVEISAEGRELAAHALAAADAASQSGADRVRGRLERGFYHDPAVAERVAERLIASGDLDVRV